MTKNFKYPPYVTLGHSALKRCLRRGKIEYYREAGCWEVLGVVEKGKLISIYSEDKDWLHKQPLKRITEKEYLKDNGGYVIKKDLPKNRAMTIDELLLVEAKEIGSLCSKSSTVRKFTYLVLLSFSSH